MNHPLINMLLLIGFSESTQVSRQPGPDAANLGVDLSFNLYSGGRTKSVIEESSYRNALAAVNSKDQSGKAYIILIKDLTKANLEEENKKNLKKHIMKVLLSSFIEI